MSVGRLRGAMVAVSMFAGAVPAVAITQPVGDSASLQEYVGRYQTVWNTHDSAAVAAFFSEEAEMVMGNLPRARGRRAIELWWRAYFERQEPERRARFDLTAERLLSANVAVVNLLSTTHGKGSGGEALPVRKARGTWLVRREGGKWQIETMMGMPTEEDRVELKPSLEAAKTLRPDVRAFLRAYEDTFDRHDPEALSAFYRDDADIIVRNGPVVHGILAIREWWEDYFSQPRPYRVELIVEEIRMMSDDVALLNLAATGAALDAKPEPAPVRRARARWVLVREDGRWLIDALRVLPSEDDRVIRKTGH